eukprot:CAMPEP_0118976974 /NCGR_PEP_ID=MMETSP1173-20130426/20214_1 /TAXON_ID=1034831 /ORGANISM="Rhizochromulina marina cf, Strain CCMP1243" /LENGTH=96 /DNA_ID=CAMNT_0006927045 /DNA_START=156 /DNA_END=447 /DNA_ORIENTATION=-
MAGAGAWRQAANIVPLVVLTGYMAYVVQDRFTYHEETRLEKLRKKRERMLAEARAKALAQASAEAEQDPSGEVAFTDGGFVSSSSPRELGDSGSDP